MTAPVERDPLVSYLRALAGRAPAPAFLELRYRVAEHALAAQFVPAHEHHRLAAAIRGRARTTDVYVGCAPRCRPSGTKDDVHQVWVLWAECDGAAAARAARSYQPEPSIVIASGSGPNVHAYWALRRPIGPQEAERANLRLARAVGADEQCFDAARILRPPGTWNHKHQPAAPVTALRMEAHRAFDAIEVLDGAPAITHDRLRRRWIERGVRDISSDPLLQLEPAVYVADLLGVRAGPGRKVRCPFHADEHPSLHVYPTAVRGWSCFSCGRGGSVYDLAGALWDMQTRGRDFARLKHRLTVHFASDLARRASRSVTPHGHTFE